MDHAEVIDRFYEAAVIPELWPAAIEAYAKHADAAGAVLFMANSTRAAGLASPNLADLFARFAQEGGLEHNARLQRFRSVGLPGAKRDQDMFSEEEIETHPFYRKLKSYGMKWSVSMVQPLPGEDEAVLSLERFETAEPFDARAVTVMNEIKPHFARSMLTSTRLSLERSAATLEGFAALGVPAATVGSSGRLMFANAPFSDLGEVFLDRRDRLAIADPEADRLFGEALQRLKTETWSRAVGSIPVRSDRERPAVVVHVIPMRRASHDIFTNASALIVASRVGAGSPLSGPMLQALFDLTPAEMRVCERLSQGLSVSMTAKALGIAEATARGHLKVVFSKCGVRKQSELVKLLFSPLLP